VQRQSSTFLAASIVAFAVAACSESTGKPKPDGGTGGVDIGKDGKPLAVKVPDTGQAIEDPQVFVDLATPAVVTPAGDPKASKDWDLAFGGLNVFTNGGVSGSGLGSGFGPLSPESFLDDFAPSVPFMETDETGGAFIDWWIYDGAQHLIWSRYHVFGVKDGDRVFKVQVLGFYGEVSGAPVTAIYSLRWAQVLPSVLPTHELYDLDGTAGGKDPPPDAASECIDLGEPAKRTMLTPAEAQASSGWHLCFRRQSISVNGGKGGPRNVGAVDLDIGETAGETVESDKAKTAASELPKFDAVGSADLTASGLEYAGDRVITAFTEHWLAPGAAPPAPDKVAWFVVGADGTSKFLLAFEGFDGATASSPGTVHMRVKSVE